MWVLVSITSCEHMRRLGLQYEQDLMDQLCRFCCTDIMSNSFQNTELSIWQGFEQVFADSLCVDDVIPVSPDCMDVQVSRLQSLEQIPTIIDRPIPEARDICNLIRLRVRSSGDAIYLQDCLKPLWFSTCHFNTCTTSILSPVVSPATSCTFGVKALLTALLIRTTGVCL